jgi:alanine dehydrogenase
MPGAVPHTSTYALTNVTLPYVLEIARLGLAGAVGRDPALRSGVNVANGHVVYGPVAEAHDLPLTALAEVLS